ncbi:MAG: FAD-linked oxidoreductase [Bermanella sp.]|jgi:FAD-linked oxidoreductase
MKRREFNRSLLLAPLAAPLATATPKAEAARAIPWQNWSGGQQATPAGRLSPKTEDELAQLLKNATTAMRPVGAGHSFSPLIPTQGNILSTRHFNTVSASDNLRAIVGAGVKLNQLGEPLHKLGQALPNMPDIDEQTIAGALSTGTHGTGANIGAMHSYVEALRLVTPRGDVLNCSRTENPDIFDAARVSLGALGVITQYTLRNVAPYKLKLKTWMQPLQQTFEEFDQLADSHRNFEMYYIPHSENALIITTELSDEEISPRGPDGDNDSVRELKMLRDYASWWPWLRKKLITAVSAAVEPEEHVDWWWNIYPSDRAVRFNEMEYHLPRENIVEALKKVIETVETRNPDVFFPIEVRVVREDDAWLSPFYGRPSASLAVHRYFEEDYKPYFSSIEPIYQPYAGRPHWGKLHTLGADTLAKRYPRWQDFNDIRRELDPKGIMLNAHLKKVFGHD